MRIDLLRDIPDDATLRRQWNALALSVDQPQVFYTYEWASAVCRAYKSTLRPLIFLGYDDENSLCGVAALASDVQGKRISFLTATTGDYCDFLSAPEYRIVFLSAVLGELRKQGVDEMAFANLPADSPSASALANAAREKDYKCFMRTGYVCSRVLLAALERRGEGKPVLPRKKMLRRFLNAMGRENPVRLDHSRSASDVQAILPQFMQAHVGRFLMTGRISNMARRERQVFLVELTKLLSENGWVVLTRMMSGEKVFAWNYGFQFQGAWFWYQPTFGSDLEKYSPGFCLLAKVIEEAAENSEFKIVDLGLGAEEYKERFANQTRETLFVTLKSSAFSHYREIARYRASTIIKSSREAERFVRLVAARYQQTKKYFVHAEGSRLSPRVSASLRTLLWAKTEVIYYEWVEAAVVQSKEVQIRRTDLDQLALAAMEYVDDEETLSYLLRSAQRLASQEAEGFVLIDRESKPVHFAWLANLDGFFVPELNTKMKSSSNDVLVFDCWTPVAVRGRNYCVRGMELIAETVVSRGQRCWISSPATNGAATHAIAKAGFQKRFSLFQNRVLWWHRPNRSDLSKLSAQEASAQT